MELNIYKNYQKAFSELNYIINNSEKEIQDKIPNKFKKLIITNMDINNVVNIDLSKGILNCKLLPETKNILTLIYRDFLCTDEEKKQLIELEYKKKRELEEKYSADKLFNNDLVEKTKITEENINSNLPVVIKQNKNIFYKIIERIKKIFYKY